MSRNLKSYIAISLKGVGMGAADVVPGVSGGTIAFITGIYEELVTSIANIDLRLIKTWKKEGFRSMWKQLNGNFILALVIGITTSIFTLMRLTNYLLETYPVIVWSFFFGLVLASIWYVGKQIDTWNIKLILSALVGFIIAFGVTLLTPSQGIDHPLYFLLCGALAICAMILPGISGAFILVLLGAYKSITAAVSELDFQVIALVGLGAIIGLLSFSRVLKWLFNHYKLTTLAVLTGFIAGSLNKIWPWKNVLESEIVKDKIIILNEVSVLPQNFEGEPQLLWAIIACILGLLLILSLEKFSEKHSLSNAKY
jgi:putative membrane protein